MNEDRAQAHALEAIAAALLLLTSVLFALEMTAVTPLSASTSSQHIENQQQASAEGILATAADSGALETAVLFWNRTAGKFHEANETAYYTSKAPPNEFGGMLERAFGEEGLAYNVEVIYVVGDQRIVQQMVNQGVPSDHAVRASRSVTLTDKTEIRDANGEPNGTAINDTSNFYVVDASPDSGVYNVVRVEVVVWRI
ncbi:hypothetical protein BRC83_05245 [Halobacteriales archaeon QS_1_68_17]|nr:MAG: hypothetical protein BRC83_05245 [Halobacteriales archaeon QS_1_68_17]